MHGYSIQVTSSWGEDQQCRAKCTDLGGQTWSLDELGHGEAASAGCDFVPRVEGWFGVGASSGGGATADGGKYGFLGDGVGFGRRCGGVGCGDCVFLL